MTGVIPGVTGPSSLGLNVPMIERDDGDRRSAHEPPCAHETRLTLEADRPSCSTSHSALAPVRRAVDTWLQSWRPPLAGSQIGTPSNSRFGLSEQGRPR